MYKRVCGLSKFLKVQEQFWQLEQLEERVGNNTLWMVHVFQSSETIIPKSEVFNQQNRFENNFCVET